MMNGSEILADDKRHRLKRMAESLRHDLMRQDGIGPEMRSEVIGRIERWLKEADAIKVSS